MDLLRVDLDYSSLKEFLSTLTQTINAQGDSIHQLQQKIDRCVSSEKVKM